MWSVEGCEKLLAIFSADLAKTDNQLGLQLSALSLSKPQILQTDKPTVPH